MSRLRRCLFGSAAAPLFVCAGCFAPTGSVTVSSTDPTDANTSGPGVTTTTDASTAVSSTSTDATVTTDLTATGVTTSTSATLEPTTTLDPGTTSTGTTGPDLPDCGDGDIDLGEECDDGPGNSDAGTCTSACRTAKCGDGLRCSACDPIEECDAANDFCSDTCLLPGKLIFATATLHAGNVGIMAADQICQDLGDNNFSAPRDFVAWLSGSQAISGRIGVTSSPYLLPGGEVVADGTKSLLNGEIQHAVDQDPTGATIMAGSDCAAENLAWTGSLAGGSPAPMHCSDWTNIAGIGLAGSLAAADFMWTERCDADCSATLRLYCIETSV